MQNLQEQMQLSDAAMSVLEFAKKHPSTAIKASDPLRDLSGAVEVPEWLLDLFGEDRLEDLLKNHAQDAEFFQQLTARMPSRITPWYQGLVQQSEALRALVLAEPSEITDLTGTTDPSGQTHYMPLGAEKGITHKYFDTCHVMIILACAAYCRYCYQADFFTGKSGKRPASPAETKDYVFASVQRYWKHFDDELQTSLAPETGQELFPITNVLLTGGDSLQASNFLLALFIVALAESGIAHIRFGSKVPVFYPQRGDEAFFALLDKVHEVYPHLTFSLVTHITHPDELLAKDKNGRYVRLEQSGMPLPFFQWHTPTKHFFGECGKRPFFNVVNQFPIIKGINDDHEVLALLLREGYRHGIHAHNIYACRQIRGHKHFELPIAEAFGHVQQANILLNGLEGKGRLVMSTRYGKMLVEEVLPPSETMPQGLIVLRRIRLPQAEYGIRHNNAGGTIICAYNADAVWIDELMEGVVMYDDVTNRAIH